jgi:hypothetical protein
MSERRRRRMTQKMDCAREFDNQMGHDEEYSKMTEDEKCSLYKEHDWDWDVDMKCQDYEFWGKNFIQSPDEKLLAIKLKCECGAKALQWYKKCDDPVPY